MSIERQQDAAARYAAVHSLVIDERFAFTDSGVPASKGANLERGAFKRFRDALAAGDVPSGSLLLIESVSRFSRLRPGHSRPILQELVDAGVTVVFLDTGMRYDTDTIDTLANDVTFTVLSHGAAEKAAELSGYKTRAWEKSRRDARAAVARGEAPPTITRMLPFWLRVPVKTDAAGKITRGAIEPVPRYARVVERIFREYLAGKGKAEIAAGLNGDKVPTPGTGKRKGDFWRHTLIYKTLVNRSVLGEYRPHREVKQKITKRGGIAGALKRERVTDGEPILGYYPRVISDELFGQAQQVLASNRAKAGSKINPGRGEIKHMLARLATCPLCGSAMLRRTHGVKSRTAPSYTCSRSLQDRGGCERVPVKVAEVERALVMNATALAKSTPSADATLGAQVVATEKALRKQEDRLLELVLLLDGTPSKTLAQKIQEGDARRDELLSELAGLKARAAASSTNVIRQKVANLRSALQGFEDLGDVQDVNAALYECFSKVVIDHRSGELQCHWRHGPPPTMVRYVETTQTNKRAKR